MGEALVGDVLQLIDGRWRVVLSAAGFTTTDRRVTDPPAGGWFTQPRTWTNTGLPPHDHVHTRRFP